MFPISDGELKTRTRPYVNVSVIVICTAVFIYQLTMGSFDEFRFIYRFGVIPAELTSGNEYERYLVADGYIDIASPLPTWATMFSSMFMHGGWMHFLGNVWFLWIFGDNIEDKFGHFKYLLFYLAAGVIAVWLFVAFNADSQIPLIGASGAIAGVLGAYLVLFPLSRVRSLLILFIFISFVRVPAFILLGIWFISQFFFGLGSLAVDDGNGIAYWAHVGGFIFGVVVAAIYRFMKFTDSGSGGRNEDVNILPEDVPQYWRGRRF